MAMSEATTVLVSAKIGPVHLGRDAYVYVRQSTLTQLREHTESLIRQYELRERAVALGWDAHQVRVIDADLGRSGAEATAREGFKDLVADVGLGRVGIIFGIEVSRLARNNADWYQLLDLCALTDTLIADTDGVYHPADFNDRLVLGLKGTMSEAELHLIRSRLTAGLRHKAARGELRQFLPVGFDYDETGAVVITPDEAVVEAIATVFRRFAELGTGRQVLLSLRGDGLLLPRRPTRTGRVHWAAGDLSGGARLLDQSGLCRGVRVRPHPHRETHRRRPARWCSAPCCCPASSGRCSSPITIPGSSTGPPMRPTPPGCGRTGAPPAGPAAARRGKERRCCRAGCGAAGAAG